MELFFDGMIAVSALLSASLAMIPFLKTPTTARAFVKSKGCAKGGNFVAGRYMENPA